MNKSYSDSIQSNNLITSPKIVKRPTFYYDNDEFKPIRAGGIIIYKIENNSIKLLLIRTNYNNKEMYEDIGGKTDSNDISFLNTISREVGEETNYVINRYLSSGAFDKSLTITSHDLGAISSLVLSQVLIDIDGKVTVVGYDNNLVQNQMIIARTVSSLLSLDGTFNAQQTPGYIKYTVAGGTNQIVNDAMIHPDGRILLVGNEN